MRRGWGNKKLMRPILGLFSICCGIYLSSYASTFGVNAWSSLRAPASFNDPDERGSEELMDAAQKQRKIEVCGARALEIDTLSNFDDRTTGWFPGRAKVLADPHEALLAKLLMIQKAKKSIDISTYIFTADESTQAILDVLRLALVRGVNIRLMVDGVGSLGEATNDQYRHMRNLLLARKEMLKSGVKAGTIDVVVFHPLGRINTILSNIRDRFITQVDVSSETAMNWNRRSHDKIFMIDQESRADAMAIVGGRNLDNSYYGYPKIDQDTYEDLEVIVTNDPRSRDSRTLATTVGRHFQNLFCSKGNRWLSLEPLGYLSDIGSRNALEDIEGAYARLVSEESIRALYATMTGESGFAFLQQGFASTKLALGNEIQNLKRLAADVFVDPNAPFVEKLYNGDSFYLQLRKMMRSADKTIDICTPYIFLSKSERDCLKKWVMDKPGRRVRILSNSSATSDSALAMATFQHESAPELLEEGRYSCVDPSTHRVSEGEFDNHDSKIQVYQFGRLNNLTFKKGAVKDHLGRLVNLSAFYGKLHSKFGIIDGRYSFIGSHNLDQRSRRLNSETAFFIDSPKIAADSTAQFEKLIKSSYLFGDPDLQIMNEREELQTRKTLMSILAFINKHYPEAGFAN